MLVVLGLDIDCFSSALSLQLDINDAAKDCGLKCFRYEIIMWHVLLIIHCYKSNYGSSLMNMYVSSSGDITPPCGVRAAMAMQAEAERKKRAQILESEGERQVNINIADGRKSSMILVSDAAKMDQVNRAQGW
ncbi:hypothetical protein R3W88_017993 [Solanum pinnatisectum]|uniref:Uncharacterized protein n=1 Tax=Solanum pinnatisectum TaxID=50273 RepID=A0AAV9L444_9SOLN|nr:hypothetical protein R3W88_017993 [Solanum pinnatisectum]